MKELALRYTKALYAFGTALLVAAAIAATTGADLSDWKVWLALVASVVAPTAATALSPANKTKAEAQEATGRHASKE